MECDYSGIERIFSEYILKLIGPTEEQNQIRESKFKKIKSLFQRAFKDKGITAHVFSFGSYPIRTYLPESDVDITIILEDSFTHQIIPINNLEYQTKILNLTQFALENHNIEVGFPQITEIAQIPAEVKLIKCKFDNLAFDISINNFVGLCKLSFMKQLESKFADVSLFKRSLFLIKSWSYYEASILGSNVGLMASYALEVLIIYMFNNYSHMFTNEIQALFTFFQIMNTTDWNKKILTIFGSVDIEEYYEKMKNNNYNLNSVLQEIKSIDLKNNSPLIKFEDLYRIIKDFEKFYEINGKTTKKVIDTKLVNIIDPLFPTNNLGKSLNYHNFTKITKIFEISTNEIMEIIKQKEGGQLTHHKYFNFLCNFFDKIITLNTPEIFTKFLVIPKILIDFDYDYDDIQEEDEDFDKLGNDVYQEYNLLTKEKIEEIITKPFIYDYAFQSSDEISEIEDFLKFANSLLI